MNAAIDIGHTEGLQPWTATLAGEPPSRTFAGRTPFEAVGRLLLHSGWLRFVPAGTTSARMRYDLGDPGDRKEEDRCSS